MSEKSKTILQENIKEWWNIDLNNNIWERSLRESESAEKTLKKALKKSPLPPLEEQMRAPNQDITTTKSPRMALLDKTTTL